MLLQVLLASSEGSSGFLIKVAGGGRVLTAVSLDTRRRGLEHCWVCGSEVLTTVTVLGEPRATLGRSCLWR